MGVDPLDDEREALVRKHKIPIPLFQAFLRVLRKKYRGKFSKYREKQGRYRRLTREGCALCGQADCTCSEEPPVR